MRASVSKKPVKGRLGQRGTRAGVSKGRKRLMGNPRPRPLRLAEKLLQIRTGLALSQTQMLERLGLGDSMHYGRISEYEQDKREPTLMTLLAYARAASVHLEDIVDDNLELPRKLPGNVSYRGIPRKSRK